MKQELVLKYLKISSIGFIIVSLLEFIDIILLSTAIRMYISGSYLTLIDILFTTGVLPIESTFLWVFLMIFPCIFIGLGFILFRIAQKEKFKSNLLSKFILLIGLLFILGSFIKIVYMIFLGNTKLNLSGSIEFQQALYNPLITPFIGAVMWIYLYSTVLVYLTCGLIFGGVGLKWILLIEEEKYKS
jgi:hypothetical protein